MLQVTTPLPIVIQGGMGAAVSSWRLARAVSMRGQLGVVSGTGADTILARRLQMGDVGGHLRAAFDAFPIPEIAERVWARYFSSEEKRPRDAFKSKPIPTIRFSSALSELTVLANFVEVYLAKRGHAGAVGINLLEKIQLPTLPSLFGAMLAGVDYVLMGAGIPRQIPGALDSLARFERTRLRIDVADAAASEEFHSTFDPGEFQPAGVPSLARPKFLAIVSSTALALTLVRKCTPPVDGLIVEGPTAGGHNAPPRGTPVFDEHSQPIYGPKDAPDLDAIRQLGVPFWLAGSYGCPEGLQQAVAAGATGVQVGTLFAFCEESGIAQEIKKAVLERSAAGTACVRTDALASPTGFPFKVVQLPGTVSEPATYETRTRICDLGYLRQPYRTADGKVGYRCPAEPVEDYLKKGGKIEDTVGRKCICNGLIATVGMGQVRKGVAEPAIVTSGDDVVNVHLLLPPGRDSYSANDVLDYLLSSPK
ncbi:MAG: nitronate monooxygenase [Armatimonadetes bacterium]|nr:nitronate monooxygenase [Armatimonadota bacterium]NOG39751.1 nitronate monooxygenase [Armatimonadota bacterium]